uniref:Uncharacterized protein n=1 Tax=Oryza sativa subsp. japonica TaxID=39947 RepID=Q75KY6_ORYSJ|nr:hypothetical protein [Oryza sativa Japonica Group]
MEGRGQVVTVDEGRAAVPHRGSREASRHTTASEAGRGRHLDTASDISTSETIEVGDRDEAGQQHMKMEMLTLNGHSMQPSKQYIQKTAYASASRIFRERERERDEAAVVTITSVNSLSPRDSIDGEGYAARRARGVYVGCGGDTGYSWVDRPTLSDGNKLEKTKFKNSQKGMIGNSTPYTETTLGRSGISVTVFTSSCKTPPLVLPQYIVGRRCNDPHGARSHRIARVARLPPGGPPDSKCTAIPQVGVVQSHVYPSTKKSPYYANTGIATSNIDSGAPGRGLWYFRILMRWVQEMDSPTTSYSTTSAMGRFNPTEVCLPLRSESSSSIIFDLARSTKVQDFVALAGARHRPAESKLDTASTIIDRVHQQTDPSQKNVHACLDQSTFIHTVHMYNCFARSNLSHRTTSIGVREITLLARWFSNQYVAISRIATSISVREITLLARWFSNQYVAISRIATSIGVREITLFARWFSNQYVAISRTATSIDGRDTTTAIMQRSSHHDFRWLRNSYDWSSTGSVAVLVPRLQMIERHLFTGSQPVNRSDLSPPRNLRGLRLGTRRADKALLDPVETKDHVRSGRVRVLKKFYLDKGIPMGINTRPSRRRGDNQHTRNNRSHNIQANICQDKPLDIDFRDTPGSTLSGTYRGRPLAYILVPTIPILCKCRNRDIKRRQI